MIYISLIFEDTLSEMIMIRLLADFQGKYEIHQSYSGHGYGYLKNNIKGFNQACVHSPYFMLTDLDRYECPLALINDWISFKMHPNFIFRIAVREVESWILADKEGLSRFFSLSMANFPDSPDSLPDPKNTLINLARKSRKRRIREDVVPVNKNASIGPNYNGCLSEFVLNHWDLHNAVSHSRSLNRTWQRLNQF